MQWCRLLVNCREVNGIKYHCLVFISCNELQNINVEVRNTIITKKARIQAIVARLLVQ